jgi:uncharacterized protein YjbI with pentapeptide repeats
MKLIKITLLNALVLLNISSSLFAYKQEDLDKLKNTGNCEKCDLTYIANLASYIDAIKRQNGTGFNETMALKISLAGSDVSGSDLSFAHLQNCDFSGVTAIRTDFSNAHMFRCDLSGSNLAYANFQHADLRGANLQNAQTKDANFEFTEFESKPLGNPTIVAQFVSWIWGNK